MQEMVVVDRPSVMPMSCVVTGDTAGVMVDTGRELRGWGRVYLSKRAVVAAARELGLVKGGVRHEQVLSALEQLEERERDIRELEEQVSKQAELIKLQLDQLEADERLIQRLDGRVAQLRDQLSGRIAADEAVLNAANQG